MIFLKHYIIRKNFCFIVSLSGKKKKNDFPNKKENCFYISYLQLAFDLGEWTAIELVIRYSTHTHLYWYLYRANCTPNIINIALSQYPCFISNNGTCRPWFFHKIRNLKCIIFKALKLHFNWTTERKENQNRARVDFHYYWKYFRVDSPFIHSCFFSVKTRSAFNQYKIRAETWCQLFFFCSVNELASIYSIFGIGFWIFYNDFFLFL